MTENKLEIAFAKQLVMTGVGICYDALQSIKQARDKNASGEIDDDAYARAVHTALKVLE